MAAIQISQRYQEEPVRLAGWLVAKMPGDTYHIMGEADFPVQVRFSSPLVLLDLIAMEGITDAGSRYDLSAPRLASISANCELLNRYLSTPQPVAWSDTLFSESQTLLPSLVHPSGPKQHQLALDKIESLRARPDRWAPRLRKFLASLDIDPSYHHQAIGLDQESWHRALRGDVIEVLPRVALNAWLIPEVIGLVSSFGDTPEWVNHWLHHSNVRMGAYTSPLQLLLAGDTGALLAQFRRFLYEAYR